MITELRVRNLRSIEDSGSLPFGPITAIVGKNNTGKSTLLRSIYLLQAGNTWSSSDIRLGTRNARVDLSFDSLPLVAGGGQLIGKEGGTIEIDALGGSRTGISVLVPEVGQPITVAEFPSKEPSNLIYPCFTRQWLTPVEEQVRKDASDTVRPDGMNLISRLSTMCDSATPPGRELASMYRRVLGDDITLSMLTAQNGQRVGVQIDRFRDIGIDSMGTGVATVLTILSNLVGAHQKVFLIEEPENDLHPQALKSLLEIIRERSVDNQFIISTHSNVVLTQLGAIDSTKVVEAYSEVGQGLPTSLFRPIETRADRLRVLRDLGYDLSDLDVTIGWLFFEESSAQRICQSYLIPWFAPTLTRVQTVAAVGVSRVPALVQNFAEMMLFAHLDDAYNRCAWVIVDGDEAGKNVVEGLRSKYRDWPGDCFNQFSEPDFERYYPSEFSAKVDEILAAPRQSQREAKEKLLKELLSWIDADTARARKEFEQSAAPAITVLRSVEAALTKRLR